MTKRPVYFEQCPDGFYCSVDGQPEYFASRYELYMFACQEQREIIEITESNYQDLSQTGAFNAEESHYESL